MFGTSCVLSNLRLRTRYINVNDDDVLVAELKKIFAFSKPTEIESGR